MEFEVISSAFKDQKSWFILNKCKKRKKNLSGYEYSRI